MENEFSFAIGPVVIGASLITTWAIMLVITAIAWFSTRHLEILPGSLQTLVEGIVAAIDEAISAVAPEHGRQILPFIATLWLFLIVANLVGLIPEMHSPTDDLSRNLGTGGFGIFLGALVWHKDSGLEKLSASLPDPQPDFAAFSYYQRIYPHAGAGRTIIRQHDEPGNGGHADFAGGRLSCPDSDFDVTYH